MTTATAARRDAARVSIDVGSWVGAWVGWSCCVGRERARRRHLDRTFSLNGSATSPPDVFFLCLGHAFSIRFMQQLVLAASPAARQGINVSGAAVFGVWGTPFPVVSCTAGVLRIQWHPQQQQHEKRSTEAVGLVNKKTHYSFFFCCVGRSPLASLPFSLPSSLPFPSTSFYTFGRVVHKSPIFYSSLSKRGSISESTTHRAPTAPTPPPPPPRTGLAALSFFPSCCLSTAVAVSPASTSKPP